jgi:hypothetical protein
MADWPKDVLDFAPFGGFSTAGEGCPVADLLLTTGPGMTSNANVWPLANLAMYFPIVTRREITLYQLGWQNGGAVTGHVDVGVYDNNQNRLVSAGSTVQSPISTIQLVDIADTTLPPGVYYLAMVADTGTGQNFRGTTVGSGNTGTLRACGAAQQATAFPLPSTATFAAITQIMVPLVFGAIEGATI